MTNQNENESASQQIENIEQEIAAFKQQHEDIETKVKDLLYSEDLDSGITHHDEMFRLQQDKLRIDTEIQFLRVKLRRLKSTW